LRRSPLIDECREPGMPRRRHRMALARFSVAQVVEAWVDPAVKHPRTMHHRGYGSFMVAGETIKLRSKMK
jgi:hypothetical protein